MAKSEETGLFDDLDAFFNAAESADPQAMERAAVSVSSQSAKTPQPERTTSAKTAKTGKPSKTGKIAKKTGKGKTAAIAKSPAKKAPPPASVFAPSASVQPTPPIQPMPPPVDPPPPVPFEDMQQYVGVGDMEGKYVAIEPDSLDDAYAEHEEPFVLVPAHVHTYLPWWVWATIALALVIFMCGILVMPQISLNRVTARLGDGSPSGVQGAMRHLVLKGDERTIAKLYSIAASTTNDMDMRLRAVDTLGLMDDMDAARALMRLELGAGTDARVRAAAINARKQREAARAAGGGR